MISSELISDFKKEGQRHARLGPIPGIVTVFDAGECSGHAYLVSEFIEGDSLATHLKSNSFSHQAAATLVAAVAAALHQAHLKGLLHRDLKPDNIILNSDGAPVIADFGLAVTEKEQLAEGPGTVGTIAYMPPEQIRGDSLLVKPQADIYSLGIVLYQMLTDQLPFIADTVEGYRDQILNRPPRPPRYVDDSIPSELERICLKCQGYCAILGTMA